MLWVPAVRAEVEHAAVRVLPLPVSATAEQPAIDVPPSLKLTLPVGAAPVTVAVNVTRGADRGRVHRAGECRRGCVVRRD